jgi:hypothetical protein
MTALLPLSWARLLLIWFAMAVAMSANGILRELALTRFMNTAAAGVTSAILGIVLIALITRLGFRKLRPGSSTSSLLSLSIVLVVLTVVFECAMGRIVDHKSWDELLAHYALWRGELWPLVLGFLALTPFLWGRWLANRRAS